MSGKVGQIIVVVLILGGLACFGWYNRTQPMRDAPAELREVLRDLPVYTEYEATLDAYIRALHEDAVPRSYVRRRGPQQHRRLFREYFSQKQDNIVMVQAMKGRAREDGHEQLHIELDRLAGRLPAP